MFKHQIEYQRIDRKIRLMAAKVNRWDKLRDNRRRHQHPIRFVMYFNKLVNSC